MASEASDESRSKAARRGREQSDAQAAKPVPPLERTRFGGSGRRHERPDDGYVPVSRSDLSKGPGPGAPVSEDGQRNVLAGEQRTGRRQCVVSDQKMLGQRIDVTQPSLQWRGGIDRTAASRSIGAGHHPL